MARLDSFCSLNMGQSPDSSFYNEERRGIPFFQGNADFGEINPTARVWCDAPTKIAHKGDILISVRAPIGALNIANTECCIGRGLAALTVNETVCEKNYLWYAIASKVEELNSKGTGSTFKAISKTVLAETDIPLPNIEKQKQIVSELDGITHLISNHKELLDTYDEMIISRFIELFGDPQTNPMGWHTLTMKEASIRLSDGPFGSNLKSEHYTDSGVRVVRLGNIGVGKFNDKDQSYISLEHYETIKKYTCRTGDVVIATLGDPNLRACIVPKHIEYAVNKSDCVHYIPKPDILNNIFVCQYINCPQTLLLAAGMVHGQTRARISSGQLAELPIYLPPIELQEQFADFVMQVDDAKKAVQESLDNLEILKKSLMQKYFG